MRSSICQYLDEPREYNAKQNVRERHIPYDLMHMWNLRNKTRDKSDLNSEHKLVVVGGLVWVEDCWNRQDSEYMNLDEHWIMCCWTIIWYIWNCCNTYIFFFNIFIYLREGGKERERMSKEREISRLPTEQAAWPGTLLKDPEVMTWAKVRHLTVWTSQGT